MFTPNLKIILSEITPRMDSLDTQVKALNAMLNQFVEKSENLFITLNSNLRNPDFFKYPDPKHLRYECIGRFAANIKKALRTAYGILHESYSYNYSYQNKREDRYETRPSNYPAADRTKYGDHIRNNSDNNKHNIPNDHPSQNNHMQSKMDIFRNNILQKISEALQQVVF